MLTKIIDVIIACPWDHS